MLCIWIRSAVQQQGIKNTSISNKVPRHREVSFCAQHQTQSSCSSSFYLSASVTMAQHWLRAALQPKLVSDLVQRLSSPQNTGAALTGEHCVTQSVRSKTRKLNVGAWNSAAALHIPVPLWGIIPLAVTGEGSHCVRTLEFLIAG